MGLMSWNLAAWPDWLSRLFWSLVIVGGSYGVGHVINVVIISRLVRLAARTRGVWDDVVVAELKRRIPLWSLLVGLWMALDYWPLTAHARTVGNGVLFAIAVASVTFAVASAATRLVTAYGSTLGPEVPVSGLTQNLVTLVVLAMGALVLLNGFGVEITPMLTALGVGGLAVALALQEPLGNLFAGLFVTLSGQIRIGDYVKLDTGLEGYVEDFSWRSTRIRMFTNNLVIVPNSKLSQAIVTNYSLPTTDLAVLVEVGVDYDSDLEQVERVTLEVAGEVLREVPGGVPDFTPFLRFHTFGDSSIDFTAYLRAQRFIDKYIVTHEFIKRLQARYKREGITIPFPIRTLVARDPALALEVRNVTDVKDG
jgi:small-conductance mechanosensitive channel